MKRKNLVTFVVAATMVFSLAGCGETVNTFEAQEASELASVEATDNFETAEPSEAATATEVTAADTAAPEAAAEAEHVPMDITGCDTFTQIVDKLQAGQGYANATIGDEDVLLVTEYTFDNIDQIAAIDAEIYRYDNGAPKYIGYITAGGTAYPLAIKDGELYACGNHFAKKYVMMNGSLMIDEEAYVNYNGEGDPTYFLISEVKSVTTGADGQVEDDSYMSAIYDEYMSGEIIEFNAVQ